MSDKLKIGHLSRDNEAKIDTTPVTNAQVIYSEKSGMQFVDYNNTRHTLGSVISGIFDYDLGYIDFSDSNYSMDDILNFINDNGCIPDGQHLKIGNVVYMYRKLHDNASFIVKINKLDDAITVGELGVPFIIHLPSYHSSDEVTINMVLSISDSDGDNVYLVTQPITSSNTTPTIEVLEGDYDADVFGLTHQTYNFSGLIYTLQNHKAESRTIKIISYSVESTGFNDHDGFYVVANGLTE